ncbi:ARP2/3 actin-organizing complex subunit Arc5 [Ancistrocladus abbreviatus]
MIGSAVGGTMSAFYGFNYGETLQDERTNGGAFIGSDGLQFPQKLIPLDLLLPSESWNFSPQNAGMRLYGGAQYHRAMAEFRLVVGGIKCPQITREEIVNACGVEDVHDGTNYSRYFILVPEFSGHTGYKF